MRTILTLAILVLSGQAAQLWDVLKNPNAGPSHDLLMKPNYVVSFRTNSDATPWRIHPEADELWFVRRGSAKVILADFTLMVGIAGGTAKEYAASAGDVVNVPRTQGYRILPSPGPFDYVAVRIFPAKRHTPLVGLGAGAEPKPMPPLIAKSEIESKLASIGKNENIHSSGAVILNYIVAPPSWPQPAIPEAHLTCDDLYFVRLGSARIAVDGYIVNPKEQPPAEIHGEKAIGAREYTVGAGDLISIPRNTMHAITPESARFGYLLVKVCD